MKNWKDIEGYEGKYQVSEQGIVYSLLDSALRNRENPIVKKPYITAGYERVNLWKSQTTESFLIHRLVAEAFIPNPQNKPCVNHKDGNKLNNNVSNLEWCTHQENMDHAIEIGNHNPVGMNNGNSKLTRNDVLDIRNAYRLGCFSQYEIAKAYDISRNQINLIVNNKSWCHV